MTRSWQLWVLALIGLLAVVLLAVWPSQPERAHERRELDGEARVEPEPDRSRAASWLPSLTTAAPRIRGRITETTSGPLTEGRVDLYCLGSAYHVSTAVGEDGEFEAPACDHGPTCVRLIHPGVEQTRGWALESDTVIELEVEPAPKLSGVIVGPDREPVPGAEILVQHGATRIASTSDAAGEFAVALPRGRPCDPCDVDGETDCLDPPAPDSEPARISISAPKLAPTEVELALDGDAPVEIELAPPAPALIGQVLDVDGNPLDERTRVLASNRAREHEQHAAEVDAEGRFQFDGLAVAEYSLRAIRDEQEIATFDLARPGEAIELRSRHAARGSTLTIEVVDADGEPIAGIRVDGGPWRAAISDADGRVEATAVLPGSYTVRVRAGECPPVRERIELEPDTANLLRRVQLPRSC